MDFIGYVAIVTSFTTILSSVGNIIQRRKKTELIKALRTRLQASYNYFFDIAHWSDRIRRLKESSESTEANLQNAVEFAHAINGVADTARHEIIAYSREHLGFVPKEEHPAHPIP